MIFNRSVTNSSIKEEKKDIAKLENSISVKNKYFNVISEWSMVSTSHGLPNIFRNDNRLIKLFWILCTLVSWGYCFYLVIITFQDFFSYNVVSSSTLLNEAPTTFPAIDICNLNPYDGSLLNDSLINDVVSEAEKELTALNAELDSLLSELNLNEKNILDFSNYNEENNMTLLVSNSSTKDENKIKADQYLTKLLDRLEKEYTLSNLTELGFKITSMLINCKFNGKKCSSSDFNLYHNYYYGNCFRFNGGLNSTGHSVQFKKSTKPGWRFGLQLELDSGDPNTTIKLSYRSGFRIVIHNQSTDIFPEEDDLNVGPGLETNIGVSRLFLSRLPSPYSDCIGDFFSKIN